jgi:hypothetical protein
MVDLQEIEDFFTLLNASKVPYFTTGGVALDGLRGRITREHDDVDVYVFEESLASIFRIFSLAGFPCYRQGSIYVIEDDHFAQVLPLRSEQDTFSFYGNRGDVHFPRELFYYYQKANLADLPFGDQPFRVALNEVLVHDTQFSKHTADRDYSRTLRHDADLVARIKNTRKPKTKHQKMLIRDI